jgi:hypothetical protein
MTSIFARREPATGARKARAGESAVDAPWLARRAPGTPPARYG